jgi:hypothetical protein
MFQTKFANLTTDLKTISKQWLFAGLSLLITFSLGCGTKVNRVATEQMLLSDAVDRAVGSIDFSPLAGQKVFLETKYMEAAGSQNLVNADYVISSLRHQLTIAHCTLQISKDNADIVIEPRVGTLATDGHETVYGIPASDGARAAGMFSGNLIPLSLLPELSVGRNQAKSAFAKIIVYAYDRETAEPIWQSGVAKAESRSRDTWIFGAGPFQKGTIHDGVRFDGKPIESFPLAEFPRLMKNDEQETLKYECPLQFASLPKDDEEELAESGPAQSPENIVLQVGHTEGAADDAGEK